MFKINNSYETEPSTSSSSVSNEAVSILNAEWDFQKGTELKDFLFASKSDVTREFGKNSSHQLNKTESSMICSSQESDFLGFTPDPAGTDAPCEAIAKNRDSFENETLKKKLQFGGSLVKRAIGSTEYGGSPQTICSEEFSDQDVRYRIEMEKDGMKQLERIEDNADECNVSRFTIEPTSSDDDADDERSSTSKFHDSSSNVPTLSINENSNNAVDNAISCTSFEPATELTKLSFNGQLKPESIIIETAKISTQSQTENKNDSNVSDKSNLEWQLQMETSREYINERSPDIFSDDENLDNDDNNGNSAIDVVNTVDVVDNNDSINVKNENIENILDNCIEKTEKATSKCIQALLSGILPPPSVTFIQHDITNLLSMYKRNAALMEPTIPTDANDKGTEENCDQMSVPLMPKHLDNVDWPQLKTVNAHGVHYNRTKYTENIEMMYMKLVERNVGQETSSSFTFSISMAAKKKPIRKLMASPGNRLSHLARRRAIFSSANLQSQSQLSNLSKLGRRPCVIDTSKLSRKEKVATPKRRGLANRRTPGRKTPGSLKKSANKLVTVAPKFGTATRETSKRALFLSPTQEEEKNKAPSIACDISRRVEKSKRVLFSPPRRLERSISNISNMSNSSTSFSLLNYNSNKKTPIERGNYFNRTNSDVSISLKRRLETDDDENREPHHSKLQRTENHDNTLIRAASENSMYQNQQLSASHKQKLLWAVSTALKKKSITSSSSNFNTYASILGKVVKRLYLESLSTKTESTSGTMLRLADRLVFWVLKGKSVDEIYLEEKARMDTSKNPANKRLSGYINRDEYLLRLEANKLNVSSHSMSGEFHSSSNENDSGRKPLTNSSSKSNVGTSALRENHDSKSAQKSTSNVSFSGRNQKNLSPYNDKSRSMSNLYKPNKLMPATNSNILKVKRQISFDS